MRSFTPTRQHAPEPAGGGPAPVRPEAAGGGPPPPRPAAPAGAERDQRQQIKKKKV
jgi:hypothetical protein